MRKKSLVSMVCVLLMALAATVPAFALPRSNDGGEAPHLSFVSEVLGWFLGLVPVAPRGTGLEAVTAAGSGGEQGTGSSATATTCDICPVGEIRVGIDPNG